MKFGAIAFFLLLIDELIKWKAMQNAWFFYKNFGIAFDLPLPSWVAIPVISLVILVAIVVLFQNFNKTSFSVPLFFIIAGGIGNLFDRVVYGFIVDYLIIVRSAFNLSDLMILGGGLVLLVQYSCSQKSLH